MVVVCCLVGNSSRILIGVATGDFRYNISLGIWNLTLRNWYRLVGGESCSREGGR